MRMAHFGVVTPQVWTHPPAPTAQDLSVITGCLTGADGAQWAILFRVDDITSVERMR